MAKSKLPPFGDLPGFDVELFHEALLAGDRDAALEEFFILIEEGHPPSFLGRVLFDAILEVGSLQQLPTANAAMSLLPHLPSEFSGLALLQTASLLFVKEWGEAERSSQAASASRQFDNDVLNGILQESALHLGADIDTELMEWVGKQVGVTQFEELLTLNEEECEELTDEQADEAEGQYLQSLQDICSIASITDDPMQAAWIAESILQYHTTYLSKQTFDQAACDALLSTLKTIPQLPEFPVAEQQDQYNLLDFAVFVETGKRTPALRFLHAWLAAKGSAEPVWGVLARCAVRADADGQMGMGIRLVSGLLAMDRNFNPDKQPAMLYAATGLLSQFPKQFKLFRKFYLEEY
ncbi:MAG: hypothetical protein OEM52_04325 [bacterium]|nr:hypothetical protein [bacterium]